MLRSDVPPPASAVTPSMSRPASLNMPFSSATAQGSVATRRPYWLTVILAAKAGVAASAIAATATWAWNRIMPLPLYHGALDKCVDRTLCLEVLYIRVSAARKVAKTREARPEERNEDRAW